MLALSGEALSLLGPSNLKRRLLKRLGWEARPVKHGLRGWHKAGSELVWGRFGVGIMEISSRGEMRVLEERDKETSFPVIRHVPTLGGLKHSRLPSLETTRCPGLHPLISRPLKGRMGCPV